MDDDYNHERFELVEMQRHCKERAVFDQEQSRRFGSLFRAVAFDRSVDAVAKALQTYNEDPESAIPVVEVFLQVFGRVLNDESSTFLLDEKKIVLVATTPQLPDLPVFSSLVGSITYTVQISMDPQVKPVGHRSFADDKKVGVADWRGGFIPAQDALAAICEMFGEKLSATIASLRANPLKSGSQRLHDFYGIGNGEYWRFSQERNGRVVVERELRLFEKRWLQAKGAGRLRYSWWLLFNGANLYRNRYRLNQRQQKK